MKKIVTMVLCMTMLLTVMVAMPIFAEDTEAVNLVVNGDFEADAAGADGYAKEGNVTEITGWTQLLETNLAILTTREGGSKWIRVFNDTDGAYSGADLPDGAGIYQTITIDTEKPWYTDYKNYKYELKYDAHKAGSIWRGSVIVEVTGADGRTEATDVTPVAADFTSNAYNADIKIDLSAAIKKIGKQPVKSITLKLTASGRWEAQSYDNVSIIPVYSPAVEVDNLFTDGSFEELATAETPAWSFAGGTAEDNLIEDTDGYDGDFYVAIDANQRIEQEVSEEIIKAGNAYLVEIYYMAVEGLGFISIESPGAGYTKLAEPTLPATGTTWDDAAWKSFQQVVIMRECDNKGLLIRLRNGAGATNTVFYDNVVVTHLPGYDTTNLLANGDFEYGDDMKIASWRQNGTVPAKLASQFVNSGSFSAAISGGYGAIQQTVYVDPMYADADFDLSFYFNYSEGGGVMPGILVRAYREDGSFTGYTYSAAVDMNNDGVLDPEAGDRGCTVDNPSYADGLHWTVRNKVFNGTINLEKAISRDTDDRPVTRFLIQLQGTNFGGTYDSVRLVPRVTGIDFVNKDATIAAGINMIKDDKLTVRAKYAGEAENAKAFISVYSVINGELQLEHVIVKSVAANGGEVIADLSGLGLKAEENVVSAFIWDGAIAPVMTKTLK